MKELFLKLKIPYKPFGLPQVLVEFKYPFLSNADIAGYLIHGLFILMWYELIISLWIDYIVLYTVYWVIVNILNMDNKSLPEFVIEGTILKKYNGDSEEVVIPEGVTEIFGGFFKWAFRGNKLHSVQFPKSLKVIGSKAFGDCPNLASVEIPEGVEKIKEGAFAYCTNLEQVKFPQSLKEINGFSNTGLVSVEIPDGAEKIGHNAFFPCPKLLQVKLPQSLKSIDEYAFGGCNSLTSIEIPSGVESIGEFAFADCTALGEITLSEGLKTIGKKAFGGCKSLEFIVIPSTVTKIEENAFLLCGNLKCVFFSGNAEIAQNAFPSNVKVVKQGGNIPAKYRFECYLVIQKAGDQALHGTTDTATQVSSVASGVKTVAGVAKTVAGAVPVVNVVAGVAGVVGRTAKEVALRTIAVNMVIELAKVFGKVYDTTTAELILDSSDDGMDSKAAGYVLSLIPLIGSALQDSSDADAMETLGWAVAEGLFEGRF